MGLILARRPSDDRPRRRRGFTGASWHPILTPTAGTIAYHVYANTGQGDPINYLSPIATTAGLTWTSAPLAYPGTWSFGVRAFNGFGEEQNVDCAVTIVLSTAGGDVSNLPLPPLAPRVLPTAGGGIRVEWTAPLAPAAQAATGYYVYLGPIAGPMAPASPTRTPTPPRWSGSVWLASGVGRSGRSTRRSDGSQRWSRAIGGCPPFTAPRATVTSSIAGSFGANISGLSNGVTYGVVVRAYNATGSETNDNVVVVTATSVGPAAVESLTATAS